MYSIKRFKSFEGTDFGIGKRSRSVLVILHKIMTEYLNLALSLWVMNVFLMVGLFTMLIFLKI